MTLSLSFSSPLAFLSFRFLIILYASSSSQCSRVSTYHLNGILSQCFIRVVIPHPPRLLADARKIKVCKNESVQFQSQNRQSWKCFNSFSCSRMSHFFHPDDEDISYVWHVMSLSTATWDTTKELCYSPRRTDISNRFGLDHDLVIHNQRIFIILKVLAFGFLFTLKEFKLNIRMKNHVVQQVVDDASRRCSVFFVAFPFFSHRFPPSKDDDFSLK